MALEHSGNLGLELNVYISNNDEASLAISRELVSHSRRWTLVDLGIPPEILEILDEGVLELPRLRAFSLFLCSFTPTLQKEMIMFGGSAPLLVAARLRLFRPFSLLQFTWNRLVVLSLEDVDADEIRKVLIACPNLETLSLSRRVPGEIHQIYLDGDHPLFEHPKLRSLELIPGPFVHAFEHVQLPSLASFRVKLTPRSILALPDLLSGTSLEALFLEFLTIEEDDLSRLVDILTAVPQVTMLAISLGIPSRPSTDAGMNGIVETLLATEEQRLLPALKHLMLSIDVGERTEIQCLNSKFVDMLESRRKHAEDADPVFEEVVFVALPGNPAVQRVYPDFTDDQRQRLVDLTDKGLWAFLPHEEADEEALELMNMDDENNKLLNML